MLREERTEVLVVGAGPVGMLTALLLSKAGVQARIIDREWRTSSRTYACALHSRTLKLLDQLGIAHDVLAAGISVDRVAFYEGEKRRAEVDLSGLSAEFPFVVVLSQSTFEHLLEERLKRDALISIDWNNQLTGLQVEAGAICATVDKLGVSAKGYSVPEMEWSVQRTNQIRALFAVGADGPNSFLAQCLKTSYDIAGDPEFFAVYEFQSDWKCNSELRVVLHEGTTSVLWPLPGNKYRWSFQLLEEHLRDFPSKERKSLIIGDPQAEAGTHEFVRKLIQARAPWFKGTFHDVDWSTDVEFQHRVATHFGQNHCWLAGDAAHQTGPAAMQSMNAGLLEAERLASALALILREKHSLSALSRYDEDCRTEWNKLLGLGPTVQPQPNTDLWVRKHGQRLVSCLPASGEDLQSLLAQLQLEFQGVPALA